eukprot:1133656-Rhodomonas_salina.1
MKRKRAGHPDCIHRAGFTTSINLLDYVRPEQFGIHGAEKYCKFAAEVSTHFSEAGDCARCGRFVAECRACSK